MKRRYTDKEVMVNERQKQNENARTRGTNG